MSRARPERLSVPLVEVDQLVECWMAEPLAEPEALAECSGLPEATVRHLLRATKFIARAYQAKRRAISLRYMGPILDRLADLATTGQKREAVQAINLLDKALDLKELVRESVEATDESDATMEDALDDLS